MSRFWRKGLFFELCEIQAETGQGNPHDEKYQIISTEGNVVICFRSKVNRLNSIRKVFSVYKSILNLDIIDCRITEPSEM